MQQYQVDNKVRLKEILEILTRYNINKSLSPNTLYNIITDLGVNFIELGRVLSHRPNILPEIYKKELSNLRANVTPINYSDLQKIIIENFHTSLNDIFLDLEAKPINVSALFQSHRAILKDSSIVILKIQRPYVFENIARDISLIKKAVDVLKLNTVKSTENSVDFISVIDELWTIAQQELNFEQEIKNTIEFYKLNSDIKYLKVPKVYENYSNKNIITLDYIQGIYISEVDKLEALGYNTIKIAQNIATSFLHQSLIDGFFHSNPIGKNILTNNQTISWVNFNVVNRLSKKEKMFAEGIIKAFVEKNAQKIKSIFLIIENDINKLNNIQFVSTVDTIIANLNQSYYKSIRSLIKDFIPLFRQLNISLTENLSKLCICMVTIEDIINKLNNSVSFMQIIKEQYFKNVSPNASPLNTQGNGTSTANIPSTPQSNVTSNQNTNPNANTINTYPNNQSNDVSSPIPSTPQSNVTSNQNTNPNANTINGYSNNQSNDVSPAIPSTPQNNTPFNQNTNPNANTINGYSNNQSNDVSPAIPSTPQNNTPFNQNTNFNVKSNLNGSIVEPTNTISANHNLENTVNTANTPLVNTNTRTTLDNIDYPTSPTNNVERINDKENSTEELKSNLKNFLNRNNNPKNDLENTKANESNSVHNNNTNSYVNYSDTSNPNEENPNNFKASNKSNSNLQSSSKTTNTNYEDLNKQLNNQQPDEKQFSNNKVKDNHYSKSLEKYVYDPSHLNSREEQDKYKSTNIKDSQTHYGKRYCHYSNDNNSYTNTEKSDNSAVNLNLSSGTAFSNGIDKLVLCFINIALLALTVICFIFNVGPSLIDNISVLSVLYFLLSIIFMLWLSVRLIKKD